MITLPFVCPLATNFNASFASSSLNRRESMTGTILFSSTILVISFNCSPSARTKIKRYSLFSFLANLSYFLPASENNFCFQNGISFFSANVLFGPVRKLNNRPPSFKTDSSLLNSLGPSVSITNQRL